MFLFVAAIGFTTVKAEQKEEKNRSINATEEPVAPK